MSEELQTKKRKKLDGRFQSEAAFEEFKLQSAIDHGYVPKAPIPLTEEEKRLIDARWSKMKKKDLMNPLKNGDLMPEKEIIEEKD